MSRNTTAKLVLVIVLAGLCMPARPALARGWFGGALGGAVLGSLVGGRDGAAAGAIIGGVAGGVSGRKQRKRAEEAAREQARARHQQYMEERQRDQARVRMEEERLAIERERLALARQSTMPAAPAVASGGMAAAQPVPAGNELVRDLQRSLIVLGYQPGPINGELNQTTIEAIRSYEQNQGLLVTGRASPELLAHMRQRGG